MPARPQALPDAPAQSRPELRIAFARYDEDGDGRITFGEFVLLLAELGDELSHPEKLLAFDATDANGDGVIDYAEFTAWWDDA